MSNEVYKAAFDYRDAGLSVIPIRADGSKAAALPSWKEYQLRLATDQELYQWFYNKHVGAAIIGGVVSGNLEMLDFDAPGILFDYRDVCRDYPVWNVLKQCVLVETPSRGAHIYYRCESAPSGNSKLAHTVTAATIEVENARLIGDRYYTIETLIETRGEGGYVIAPSSPAECHPDRRPYTLKHGSFTTLPIVSVGDRAILHEIARSFGDPMPVQPQREPRSFTPASGLTPWDDYDRRGDCRHALEAAGWTMVRSHGNKEDWRRPGKREGVSATFDHCNKDGVPLFYVFSSNAYPFEANKSYGPYNVLKALSYGGDPSATAKALILQGYGQQRAA